MVDTAKNSETQDKLTQDRPAGRKLK